MRVIVVVLQWFFGILCPVIMLFTLITLVKQANCSKKQNDSLIEGKEEKAKAEIKKPRPHEKSVGGFTQDLF